MLPFILPRVAHLPGPPKLPVVGPALNFMRFWKDPVKNLNELYATHGKIFSVAHENPIMVFAVGPEFNRQFLSDQKRYTALDGENLDAINIEKRPNAIARLNNAVVAMNGPKHERLRRMIRPILHEKALPKYVDDMVTLARQRVDSWAPDSTLDMFEEMRAITLRIAIKTLLGLDPDTFDAAQMGQNYRDWMTVNSSIPSHLFPINVPGMNYHKLMKLSVQLEKFTMDVIESKRGKLENQDDVLAVLMKARDEEGAILNDDDLVGNTHILFIIGHQTMTDVLTWTWFLLSQSPDALKKAREEVEQVFEGRRPTLETVMGRLPYLDSVLKESLRLFAPTIFQMRSVTEEIQVGPYTMPPKAFVGYVPYLTHRMPELFPDPLRFKPERWTEAKPDPFEYLPFGAGAHGCLGPHFAMLEMKIVLTSVLQKYQLVLSPQAKMDRTFDATLCPKYGVPMVVAPKERPFVHNRAVGDVNEMVDLS